MESKLGVAKVESVETVAETRFLRLEKLTYTTPFGIRRKWDRVSRVKPDESLEDKAKREEGDAEVENDASADADGAPRDDAAKYKRAADAVCVFAVMRSRKHPEQPPETVLVKQFRPATGGTVVELPAGLIDKGESPGAAALREFKEETGLTGSVLGVSPATYLSAGLSSETVCIVIVQVNLDAEENQDVPTTIERPEENEYLEVERVPLSRLLVHLDRLSEEGMSIFTGLYTLAFGLSMGWTHSG
ncbi:ADP-sugar pyrophosphatase [Porphyridium purpureum]|uniref:ADP-sugar pyrophosphatase n=1 Tax=Porphyridium purpureum TaxID=35688 RepID=A0A5J4YTM9_PORPP|nr:ADP-sugar pyrophosphatase [Porphyridium purpureum]|eukprot:POR3915..scf229_5